MPYDSGTVVPCPRQIDVLRLVFATFVIVCLTFAVAAGASAATLSWSKAQPLTSESGVKMKGIACPSTTQCTAVWAIESEANHEPKGEILEVTFDPLNLQSAHAAGVAVVDGPGAMEMQARGVACPSLT